MKKIINQKLKFNLSFQFFIIFLLIIFFKINVNIAFGATCGDSDTRGWSCIDMTGYSANTGACRSEGLCFGQPPATVCCPKCGEVPGTVGLAV